MLEKPNIQEEIIQAILHKQYGLRNIQIEFIPVGNDVNTAVYRVISAGHPLYLKLRKGDFTSAAVMVPYLLKEQGVRQVIAPLPTNDQQEWVSLNEYSLALYPFIEGENGFQHPLSEQQWVELGRAVKGLHTLRVPEEIATTIPRENYSPKYREKVRTIMQELDQGNYHDEAASTLAVFLNDNEKVIDHIVDRAEELSAELRDGKSNYVLCHADLHAGNVLIDQKNQLYIIDWDTLIFALKERDLMFVGGGIGGAWNKQEEEEELFYNGYGSADSNHTALTYYRYERIVEDIAEFCQRLLDTNKGGKDRERSLGKFIDMFSPNNVIEIAQRE